MQVTTIGIDLAKQAFQVLGVDAAGRAIVHRKLRRSEIVCHLRPISHDAERRRNPAPNDSVPPAPEAVWPAHRLRCADDRKGDAPTPCKRSRGMLDSALPRRTAKEGHYEAAARSVHSISARVSDLSTDRLAKSAMFRSAPARRCCDSASSVNAGRPMRSAYSTIGRGRPIR